MRRTQPPSRWQWGNFAFNSFQTYDNVTGTQNVVQLMAQVPLLFTPESTGFERAIARNVKAIDVGGIVVTGGVEVLDISFDALDPTHTLIVEQLVVTDRLLPDGSPASVLAPWQTNTPPVTPGGSANAQDEDFPNRILNRWTEAITFNGNAGVEAGIYNQGFSRRYRKSLKLKTRVLPQFGLHYVFHGDLLTTPGETADIDVRMWARGTIYYKYVW